MKTNCKYIKSIDTHFAYDDTIDNVIEKNGLTYKELANPFIDKREYIDRLLKANCMKRAIKDLCKSTKDIYYDRSTIDLILQHAANYQKPRIMRKLLPIYPAYISKNDVDWPSRDWMNDPICLAENYWHHKQALMRRTFDRWTKKTYAAGGLEIHRLIHV